MSLTGKTREGAYRVLFYCVTYGGRVVGSQMLRGRLRALAWWQLAIVLSATGSLEMAARPQFPTAHCRS